MMITYRPTSLVWFERLFFSSIAVTFLDLIYHQEILINDLEDGGDLEPEFAIMIVGALLLTYGVQMLFWFFITHRASSIARSLYSLFWVLGLIGIFGFLSDYTDSEKIFLAIAQALSFGSVVSLFRSDARAWFKTRGELPGGDGDELQSVFR